MVRIRTHRLSPKHFPIPPCPPSLPHHQPPLLCLLPPVSIEMLCIDFSSLFLIMIFLLCASFCYFGCVSPISFLFQSLWSVSSRTILVTLLRFRSSQITQQQMAQRGQQPNHPGDASSISVVADHTAADGAARTALWLTVTHLCWLVSFVDSSSYIISIAFNRVFVMLKKLSPFNRLKAQLNVVRRGLSSTQSIVGEIDEC